MHLAINFNCIYFIDTYIVASDIYVPESMSSEDSHHVDDNDDDEMMELVKLVDHE